MIRDLERRRSAVEDELVFKRTEVQDLQREQTKADTDVEQVRSRRVRSQNRLDRGQVSSPRELESLQHELQSLDRRISDLEDAELDVMDRLESAEAELAQLQEHNDELAGSIEANERSRDEALLGIDGDLDHTGAARDKLASELPGDLVALYERLRASHSGVGAAELTQRRCGGCRLDLNAADLRAIAAAGDDEVVRCEECSRILVRASASGA